MLSGIVNSINGLRSWDGKSLESHIEFTLINYGYRHMPKDFFNNLDCFKNIKYSVLEGQEEYIRNCTNFDNTFICQPFGSQSYPDILIFKNNRIIPLEIKFSATNSKPMWNNSLPRQSGYYIMALSKEFTFIKGSQVITKEMETKLKTMGKICQEISKTENVSDMDMFKHGWDLYIRVNFQQTKNSHDVITSFLTHPNRNVNHNNAIMDLDVKLT